MLHLLQSDTSRKYRYAWKDESFLGFEQHVCSQCGRAVSQMRYDGVIHRLVLEGGEIFLDHMAFTGAGDRLFLLSEKAVLVLENSAVTGFSGKRETLVPDGLMYFTMDISGSVELDFAAMYLKKKKYCPQCGQFTWNRQRMEPILLDENTWDGRDFCKIRSFPGMYVCSDRAAGLIRENGLTGFRLTPVGFL